MSRVILYQTLTTPPFGGSDLKIAGNASSWEPLNPEVFAKPFGAHLQDNFRLIPAQTSGPQNTVPGSGFWGLYPEVFKNPFLPTEQQWVAQAPQQPPEAIAPSQSYEIVVVNQTTIHQSVAHVLYPVPSAPHKEGWEGQQLAYKYAQPFPASAQQYVAHLNYPVPSGPHKEGWEGQQFNYGFAKPFPVANQQYVAHLLYSIPINPFPEGWRGTQFDYRFAKPFPPTEQDFTPTREPVPPPPPGFGWWGLELEVKFSVPFPVASQQYEAYNDWASIPPYLPPGSGKRYKPPFDYLPPPPYEVPDKPHKPVKPIWDRGGKIEEPKPEAPRGPPPLPPMSIFGASGTTRLLGPNGLPTFDEYVPHNALAMQKRMQEALDESDAIAALRALGLIKDE